MSKKVSQKALKKSSKYAVRSKTFLNAKLPKTKKSMILKILMSAFK